MATGYYLVLNGQVEGPVEMTEIVALMEEGRVSSTTQVSHASDPDEWIVWRELRPDLYGIPAAIRQPSVRASNASDTLFTTPTPTERPTARAYNASDTLISLRSQTAYPKLRLALNIFAMIDLSGAVVLIASIFVDPSSAELYTILTAACLIGIVPLALSGALIDIADASLTKL